MYKSTNLIVNTSVFIITIIFAMVAGQILNTLYATTFFMLLRLVNKGHHLKTAEQCIFLSSAIFITIVCLSNFLSKEWVLTLSVFSFLTMAVYAPYKYSTRNDYIIKKIIMLSIIVINYIYINSLIIAIGLSIQSIDVIKYKRVR